jgi:hypothetical protein
MKTAMQELIEKIELNDYWIPNHIKNELLEKEKQNMKDIFEHCWNHPNWKGEYDIKDMEDYLKNFNQNK